MLLLAHRVHGLGHLQHDVEAIEDDLRLAVGSAPDSASCDHSTWTNQSGLGASAETVLNPRRTAFNLTLHFNQMLTAFQRRDWECGQSREVPECGSGDRREQIVHSGLTPENWWL
jgi:hypothetical protein